MSINLPKGKKYNVKIVSLYNVYLHKSPENFTQYD